MQRGAFGRPSSLGLLEAGTHDGLSPVDRLVWGSLVDNSGLTGYMGECLVLEALDAGLGLDDVEAVLCGSVPGFAAARGAKTPLRAGELSAQR